MKTPKTDGIVIAGGGLAAQRCAETLRRSGHDGAITIVCAESHAPYDRPPLSKTVLADAQAEGSLAFRPSDWYADNHVRLWLGVSATALDLAAGLVHLSDGSRMPYARLLIATGSRPRALPALARFDNVTTLRTLDDARRLRDAIACGARLAVIGAGFIGQEVAAAARLAGLEVTMIEAAPLPLAPIVGERLGAWFADLHREEGVELLLGAQLTGAAGNGRVELLELAESRVVACDHVVVGVGVEPDLRWLRGSGLPTDGVPTDDCGRTEAPHVYAAGDAAAAFDPVLGRHAARGHWESAGRQGARAARAMLGLDAGAHAPSSFWSDQYGTRVQYLGHAQLADRVRIDGDPAERDFTAIFTRAGRPIAALLVNRPGALPAVRRLLTGANHDETSTDRSGR